MRCVTMDKACSIFQAQFRVVNVCKGMRTSCRLTTLLRHHNQCLRIRLPAIREFIRYGHTEVKPDGSVIQIGLEHWKKPAAKTVPLDALPLLEEEPKPAKGATMLKYIIQMQQKYSDAVILTQVGSFMELYFDQAVEFANKLHIKLARKNQNNPITGESYVPMAGFPLARLEYYEKILVQDLGKTVVVLSQDPAVVVNGGEEKDKRPVERILTKGTLLAESFVEGNISNYLLAIHVKNAKYVALSWVDLADGIARYTMTDMDQLGNELARVNPSEIVINGENDTKLLLTAIEKYAPRATHSIFKFPPADWWSAHKSSLYRYNSDTLPQPARKAFTGLTAYIEKCMPGSSLELEPPVLCSSQDFMQLDINARSALDMLVRTGTHGRPAEEGSLLSVIRRTRTASGSRLLQEWLMAPLVSPDMIRARQDKVQFFINQPSSVISILRSYLGEMPDGPRVLQKISLRKLDPMDLVTIANSIMTLQKLKSFTNSLENGGELLNNMEGLLQGPLKTAKAVLRAINIQGIETSPGYNDADADADANAERANDLLASKSQKSLSLSSLLKMTSEYKSVLLPNVSKQLKELHHQLNEFQDRYEQISSSVVEKFGANASLRWHKQHKFCVHVKTPNPVLDSIRRGETAGSVITENKGAAYIADNEWKSLGIECMRFNEDLRLEEQRQLEKFRQDFVKNHTTNLRKAYALVDEIDVHLSLATLAKEKRLVRPEIIEDSRVFEIIQGRHITVEAGMAIGGHATQDFVANDCILTAEKPVSMITGPNMGGKSTYIRQAAIVALLAHIGSFVPCEKAVIGVVDRIFCRIGAGDDLYRGRSTFMLEMLETATILNDATSRSLAILDEVGRGTSVKESEAIAFATIKHLAHEKTCRTLFATHYGSEIWEHLASPKGMGSAQSIQCLQSSAAVIDGELEFDYMLRPGISKSSCGLLVAQMAGFPQDALQDAKAIASA